MENKTVYIGLHIPKTAGTTLITLLEEKMHSGEFHQTTSLVKNAELDIPFIEEMTSTKNIKTLFGHHIDAKTICYFPSREIYLYTFIREPILRMISHFYYHERLHKAQGRKIMTFREFADFNNNQICRFILNRYRDFLSKEDIVSLSLHEKAIKILQTFDLVGCSEDFDEYLLLLLKDMKVEIDDQNNFFKKIGKKHVTPRESKNVLANEEINSG